MQYRPILRLATLTAFALFTQNTVLHAQKARNTVIAANLSSGEIKGNITTDGAPLSGVHVLLTFHGKAIGDHITGADGTYIFKELSPGKYDLSVTKDGYRKRIVNDVPVVEEFTTSSTMKLAPLSEVREENVDKVQRYEELKTHKIAKMD